MPNSTPSKAAVVIVGGGMAGLSCAASLARRGITDVVLLEAHTLAHAKASSFGETRMFREMYSDPVLCRLAQEANRLWREEEIHAGEQLRETHGLLFYGESWDQETIEGSIPGARRVMDDQGIPYEALDASQIASRFPLKPKADFTGLFEPTAGAVRSDKVVAHWINTARNAGHQLIEHCPVAGLDADGGGVTLENGEHIAAGQLVVACGIWSQLLLAPLGLAPKLEVWPMLWAHYTVDPELADRYPQWFCFQRERGDDGGLYYGFPVLSRTDDGRPRIKAGIDWAPKELRVAEPNAMTTEPPARLVELLDTFLFNELEGVRERVETVISPYSMASDVNFVLDRLTPRLSLFAGGSGQAFKFAPLIGDSLARLAAGEQPAVDLSCWSHHRDAVSACPLPRQLMSEIPASQRSWWRQPPLWVGAIPLLIFLLVSAVDLALAKHFTENGKAVISDALGGVWQWMVVLLFLIALILAISPAGKLRLGGAEAKPSLKFFDWCAVLICTLLAGGGVFWSAAEPLYHFQTPSPIFQGIEGGTAAAVDPALAVSFLHWGFLAWALVATTTTITFSILEQRGEPLRPRTLLVNIVPRSWVDGPLGHLADGLSVVSAIAGTVGPLGFLSLQLSNAAGQLPWLTDSAGLQSLVVLLLTAVFATSTVSGIQKGIKWLSELNVWLTLAMAAGLLLLGPGLWLIEHFFSGFLTYLIHLPQMALTPNVAPDNWINGWTVFYWGWFLGYAPLMGLFTAGVSRGRSIRELVLAVAILCPIVTNIWFTLLGGTGLHMELAGGGIGEALAQNGAAAALLSILSQLPLAALLIPVGLVLVVLFMCTSADSMSYAAAMVVSGRNEPPAFLRLFWALMIGSLTLVLLRIGSGLGDSTSIDALQAFIVITAVPVTPLVLATLWSAPRLAWKEAKREGLS